MFEILNSVRGITFGSLLLKLTITILCGAAIGLERSAKNRPAGFRTHILVCLGGAVAAIAGQYLYLGMHLPADITRISGQVITGLGFIGAGTIIVTKDLSIIGLTTAAGLWTTGIIGIAIGSGYYEAGILGTACVLIAEVLMAKIGWYIHPDPEQTFELKYNDKESLDEVMRFCKDKRMSIKSLQIHTLNTDEAKYSAEVTLRIPHKKVEVVSEIETMPGILSVIKLGD